jgi:hypothetical protein
VKTWLYRGNRIVVEDIGVGYVATLKRGPVLDRFRRGGGTGFPTFASKDLTRLREMIEFYVKET